MASKRKKYQPEGFPRTVGIEIHVVRVGPDQWTGRVLKGAANVPIQRGSTENEVIDLIHKYIQEKRGA